MRQVSLSLLTGLTVSISAKLLSDVLPAVALVALGVCTAALAYAIQHKWGASNSSAGRDQATPDAAQPKTEVASGVNVPEGKAELGDIEVKVTDLPPGGVAALTHTNTRDGLKTGNISVEVTNTKSST